MQCGADQGVPAAASRREWDAFAFPGLVKWQWASRQFRSKFRRGILRSVLADCYRAAGMKADTQTMSPSLTRFFVYALQWMSQSIAHFEVRYRALTEALLTLPAERADQKKKQSQLRKLFKVMTSLEAIILVLLATETLSAEDSFMLSARFAQYTELAFFPCHLELYHTLITLHRFATGATASVRKSRLKFASSVKGMWRCSRCGMVSTASLRGHLDVRHGLHKNAERIYRRPATTSEGTLDVQDALLEWCELHENKD